MFELQAEAKKQSKGRKQQKKVCDASKHLIKICTKQRIVFAIYNEREK